MNIQDKKSIQDTIRNLLILIGEKTSREGLLNTPKRVAESYERLFGGYTQDPKDILTTFSSEGFDELITLTNIDFYSMCEHHMLPFFGKAHIGYIPTDKIVGISKLARIVDIYARRLQNQERITQQICDAITKALNPTGVIVVLEAQHLCMRMRGVEQQNSIMKTSKITGVFADDNKVVRQEFFSLLK